ncbi:hypothetical protein HID58_042424, partial [Brassica napus]
TTPILFKIRPTICWFVESFSIIIICVLFALSSAMWSVVHRATLHLRLPSRRSDELFSCGTIAEEPMAIYVASGQLSRGIAAATLRYATAMGSYPTSFREERDTFGPIQVRSNNPDAETLQNFEIGGDRERMPEPIVSAFDVLKKCAAIAAATEIN